jgi:hypothetical protein
MQHNVWEPGRSRFMQSVVCVAMTIKLVGSKTR